MKNDINETLMLIKKNYGERSFSVGEIYEDAKSREKNLPISTLRWRLYHLKKAGEIESIARGHYTLRKFNLYENKIDSRLNNLAKELQKKFPYTKFCCWSSAMFNEFTIHQTSINFYIIEIEKEAIEGAFSFLREKGLNVYLSPTKKELKLYIKHDEQAYIVKPLLKRTPLGRNIVTNFSYPKFEKLLVDILADDELFSMFQGQEVKNIWRGICKKYSINFSTLNNYSKRRRVEEKVQEITNDLEILQFKVEPDDSRNQLLEESNSRHNKATF